MRIYSVLVFVLASLYWSSGSCAVIDDFAFDNEYSYKDWRLICDNTRTCRAVVATENKLALLVTRDAGPNKLPTSVVIISDFDRDSLKKGGVRMVVLRINRKIIGRLNSNIHGEYFMDEFKTALAIEALKGRGRVSIEVFDDSSKSSLVEVSGGGASAVFLKMDELQGRVGTSGALVRKGFKDEYGVSLPVDIPVVYRVIPDKSVLLPLKLAAGMSPTRSKLAASLSGDGDCPLLFNSNRDVDVHTLGSDHVLLSTICDGWEFPNGTRPSSDYRVAFWVMDKGLKGMPSLVTLNGMEYGRGLIVSDRSSDNGDCWRHESWIWDGDKFVNGASYVAGVCGRKMSRYVRLPAVVVDEIVPDVD